MDTMQCHFGKKPMSYQNQVLHLGRVSMLDYPLQKQETELNPAFFLFDYYDYLRTSFDEQCSMDMASQSIQLVSFKTTNEHLNPLNFKSSGEGPLFAALILVSFMPCSDGYNKEKDDANVFDFLKKCSSDIEIIIKEVVGDENKSYYIYNSMGYADLCIVLRTNSPQIPYSVATKIRKTVLNEKAEFGFPKIECDTYTILGLETHYNEEGIYQSYSASEELSKIKIALRLSVSSQIDAKFIEYINESFDSKCNGLYGRYDLTFTINMNQFFEIYPFLCWLKFSRDPKKEPKNEKSQLLKHLSKAVQNEKVLYINERILLNEALYDPGKIPTTDIKQTKFRKEESFAIENQLNKLQKRWIELPYVEQQDYYKCITKLKKMWDECRALRTEADSYITSNVFIAQMWMAIRGTNNVIDIISENSKCENDHPSNRKIIEDSCTVLIKYLHTFIAALDQSQRLMQSVNRQTIQSAIHNFQGSSDLGKYIIAYMEYARQFLTRKYKSQEYNSLEIKDSNDIEGNSYKEPHQYLLPIITIDPQEVTATAAPLFLSPYKLLPTGTDEKNAFISKRLISNTEDEHMLLSILLPDAEALYSPYITIPRICHELAHNIRILTRKNRNETLLRFVLDKMSMRIAHRWILQKSSSAIFINSGITEQIIESFSETIYNQFYKCNRNQISNANIGALLTYLLRFITEDILVLDDDTPRGQNRASKETVDLIIKLMRLACKDNDEICLVVEQFNMISNALSRDEDAEIDDIKNLEKMAKGFIHSCYDKVFVRCLANIRESCANLNCHIASAIENNENSNDNRELEKLVSANGIVKDLLQDIINKYKEHTIEIHPGFLTFRIPTERELKSIINGFEEYIGKIKGINLPQFLPDLKISSRNLIYLVQESGRELIDGVHLANAADKNLELCLRSRERHRIQDGFLEELRNNLVQKLSIVRNNIGIYYSAASIQDIMVQLESDVSNPRSFADSMDHILRNWVFIDCETLIQQSTTLYREVFADLGMCATLDLDVFGYLRVLACDASFMSICQNERINNAALERARLVVHVLKQKENNLKDAINKCLVRLKTVPEKSEELTNLLNEGNCHEIKPYPVKAIESIDEVKSTSGYDNESYNKYRENVDLWNVAYLLAYCQDNELKVKDELIKHLDSIYRALSITAKHYFQSDKSATFSLMSNYYNNGSTPDVDGYASDFVLYYYYMGWKNFNVIPREDNAEWRLNKWLNELIGVDDSDAK